MVRGGSRPGYRMDQREGEGRMRALRERKEKGEVGGRKLKKEETGGRGEEEEEE